MRAEHIENKRCLGTPNCSVSGLSLPAQAPGVQTRWPSDNATPAFELSQLALSGAQTSCPHQALPKVQICE